MFPNCVHIFLKSAIIKISWNGLDCFCQGPDQCGERIQTERTGSQGWASETVNLIGQEDEQEQAKNTKKEQPGR